MKKFVTLLFIAVLCFAYAEVQAQTLSVIMKSELRKGERPIIRVVATSTPIQIDWGDGNKINHTVNISGTTVTSIGRDLPVDNPTIKVYGKFTYFFVYGNALSSLEFQGSEWGSLKRLDCQNNLLTSLVFPASAGFSTQLGTVQAYNNNFDVCAIEALYRSLPNRTSLVAGTLPLTGNGSTVDGEGNVQQNEAVKLYSRISLATTLNWNVRDYEFAYPGADITESPTALGCTTLTVSENKNASELNSGSGYRIVVYNGGHLTIDEDKTYISVTVNAGGKLTLAQGKKLTAPVKIVGNFTYGTGTYVDENTGTGLPAIAASVSQWLPALTTRTWWYLSSPVTGAPFYVLSPNSIGDYSETTRLYSEPFTTVVPDPKPSPYVPDPPVLLGTGKGYAVKMNNASNAYYEIRDKVLNNGDISVQLTRTLNGTSDNKRGFNLVGNPYPSFIDWDLVHADAVNIRDAVWFRTLGETDMTFHTYGDGEAVPITANVSGMIAPMQGFWVKVDTDPVSPETVSTGTINFKNTHRKHFETGANPLKVKAVETRTRLRLVVSNGTATDEMLMVGKSYASDDLDSYDIEKMSNENIAIPEIYSRVNSQELVINSMNSLTEGKSVVLGFRPGQAGTFTIETTQMENIDAKVLLIDNVAGTEQELVAGTPYTFTSDGTDTNDRFLISFVSRISTGFDESLYNGDLSIYSNRQNHIEVTYTGKINENTSVSVFNVAGQQLSTQRLLKTTTELDGNFNPGAYVIRLTDGNRSITKKLIVR